MEPTPKGLGDVQLHLVDNVQEAHNFLRWLGERRPNNAISIDIETGEKPGNSTKDALSPWHGRIRLCQVGDSMQGWSIPWDDWKGVFYQGLDPFDGVINFHNIAFEAKWFALQSRWKLPWHRAHDTMLMSQVVDPLGSAALKRLSEIHVDPKAAALQATLNEQFAANGWTWGTVPITFQPYWAYGALDTVMTNRIAEHYQDLCLPGKPYAVPYELEMQTRRIVTRMELNGARVDLDYSQEMLDTLTARTDRIKEWGKKNYHGTSITSNVQLVRLFEELGAEITELTPSGNKSMTKDQLKIFKRDGDAEIKQLAELVLEQRKNDKLASSYFSNFLNDHVDGIVHPSVRTMGARTGRMSITDPALQTLPSGDATVRKAFIPRDDGNGIISSDLDQVEFRLTACYSQDKSLIDLFLEADRTGGDVFTQIMRQVYNDDSLQKSDPRRKLIKGTVYGKLYGAGVDKMALTSGVQTGVMADVVSAFDSNYPGVKMMQKQIENAGMQRLRAEGTGYVTTKTGRRLPCDEDRVYSLTNYLIQATAAEIFKQNLVKIDQADLTEYLIVPVHDEIVLEAPLDEAKDIAATVRECMTTREGWAVPLTADVEGPFESWGAKYEKDH